MSEKSLSEKRVNCSGYGFMYEPEDVEEAVRRLKREFDYTFWANFDYDRCLVLEGKLQDKLNEIFGEELSND